MIKAILFDKDGTLIDFSKTWGQWATDFLHDVADGDLALLGRLADAFQFDLNTLLFDPNSPVIAGTPDEGIELIHPLLPNWEFEALLARSNQMAYATQPVEVVPLHAFLTGLRDEGFKIGIATNDAEITARVHMETLGVADLFDGILGSDSGHGGKPGPGMCLAFAQSLGIDPAQVLMVGDSTHDFDAGRAAGMPCAGVLTGVAGREALEPYADIVLDDIAGLPQWLRSRAA